LETQDQHLLYEEARKRAKQKKNLYFHFIIFLIGSVFLILLNKYLGIYPDIDWFLWAIMAWLFILIIHTINVFVIKRFFGEEWERKTTEKLIEKHEKKAAKLEKKLEKQGVFSEVIQEKDPEKSL
jgi:hypothetical protein